MAGSEYRVRVDWFGGAAAVALGLVVSLVTSTVVAGRAIERREKTRAAASREISVKGSARTRITSDTGVWDVAVAGEGKTLGDAYQALDKAVAGVRGFMKSAGFASTEVSTGAISTEEHFARDAEGRTTREVQGYTLRQWVTVSSTNVKQLSASAGEVTNLIKDGLRVSSSYPKFYYSKIAELKVQLLGDASKDARARAEEIVGKTGSTVGPIRDARMGVLQITRPHSIETSYDGMYDTSTIEKDVTAVVAATFGIE